MPRAAVLILDFGSQYTQLIARRVREHGVYSEIVPGPTPLAEIRARKPSALILSGSPASGYRDRAPLPDAGIYELGCRCQICYGSRSRRSSSAAAWPRPSGASTARRRSSRTGVRRCSTACRSASAPG
jgi:GMP synthase (glutamine-hydrolysing)